MKRLNAVFVFLITMFAFGKLSFGQLPPQMEFDFDKLWEYSGTPAWSFPSPGATGYFRDPLLTGGGIGQTGGGPGADRLIETHDWTGSAWTPLASKLDVYHELNREAPLKDWNSRPGERYQLYTALWHRNANIKNGLENEFNYYSELDEDMNVTFHHKDKSEGWRRLRNGLQGHSYKERILKEVQDLSTDTLTSYRKTTLFEREPTSTNNIGTKRVTVERVAKIVAGDYLKGASMIYKLEMSEDWADTYSVEAKFYHFPNAFANNGTPFVNCQMFSLVFRTPNDTSGTSFTSHLLEVEYGPEGTIELLRVGGQAYDPPGPGGYPESVISEVDALLGQVNSLRTDPDTWWGTHWYPEVKGTWAQQDVMPKSFNDLKQAKQQFDF